MRLPRSTGSQKPSRVLSKSTLQLDLPAIDALLELGGLTRAGRTAGRSPRAKRKEVSAGQLRRPSAAPRTAENGAVWLPIPGWDLPWLLAGFSTRQGGVSRAYCADNAPGEMNLGFTTADDRAAVEINRRLLAESIAGDPNVPIAVVRQVHSSLVVVADRDEPGRERPRKADGILSAEHGFLIGVQVADCIPVLVADKRRRIVAAFHAGWRGTVKRIVEAGVGRMRMDFGCEPKDLIAAIGPGIGPCCYSVGEEVVSEFESQFPYSAELFHEVYDEEPVRLKYPMLFLTQRAPGHSPIGPQIHLDLVEANRRQLLAAGVRPKAIAVVGGCTMCQPELFFSHRGAQGHAGRMMAVIGIRGEGRRG